MVVSCIAGSQMVVSSLSTEGERAGALARLGVSYGLGLKTPQKKLFLPLFSPLLYIFSSININFLFILNLSSLFSLFFSCTHEHVSPSNIYIPLRDFMKLN
jgi:hypothetical protein